MPTLSKAIGSGPYLGQSSGAVMSAPMTLVGS
jgi:hypothetical protein